MEFSNWQYHRIENKGLGLSALLRKTEGTMTPENPLVIVCHGFTGTKEGGGRALEMGDALAGKGFSTLLFDFAGCGESEGNWADLTLSGQVSDLEATVNWGRSADFNRIILTGRSFGGSTVLAYAAGDPDLAAVCTWAAVARLEPLFNRFIGNRLEGPAEEILAIAGEEGMLELKRKFFIDLKSYNIPSCAAKITPRKLLVIHGSADEAVPCSDAELIYNSALEPKELTIIKGANHRFSEHLDQVWACFFGWLKTI
jgi:putative redox protein